MLNICMLASVILGVGKLYDWGEIQVLAGLAPFSQTVGHLEILSERRCFCLFLIYFQMYFCQLFRNVNFTFPDKKLSNWISVRSKDYVTKTFCRVICTTALKFVLSL
jgi:hypothetical protein